MEPGPLDALWPEWRQNMPALCVPVARDEFALLRRTARCGSPSHRSSAIRATSSCRRPASAVARATRGRPRRGYFPRIRGQHADLQCCGHGCWRARGGHGSDAHGNPRSDFVAGAEIRAGRTLIAEGCRGSLAKLLIRQFGLDAGRSPQTYALGFKELWQLPPGRGRRDWSSTLWDGTGHATMAAASCTTCRRPGLRGLCDRLDYLDPRFALLSLPAVQASSFHPALLEGGEILAAGARSIAAGGWQSMPRLDMPGAILLGDAAGT